jgi:hypothetical protein
VGVTKLENGCGLGSAVSIIYHSTLDLSEEVPEYVSTKIKFRI